VLCLCYFLRKVPEMALEIRPLVRRSLGDRDPGVVWAAVEVYQQLAIVGYCFLVDCSLFVMIYLHTYLQSLLFCFVMQEVRNTQVLFLQQADVILYADLDFMTF